MNTIATTLAPLRRLSRTHGQRLLLDMAIHTFDQARYMMGLDAVSAYCDEFNLPGSWYRGNASALAVFEMTSSAETCYWPGRSSSGNRY